MDETHWVSNQKINGIFNLISKKQIPYDMAKQNVQKKIEADKNAKAKYEKANKIATDKQKSRIDSQNQRKRKMNQGYNNNNSKQQKRDN